MNVRFCVLVLGACALSVASAAEYRQSVGVSALDIFNVGISGSVAAPADPPTTAKTNHEYFDGYNRVDSSGNLGEGAPGLPSRTSNFGFTSDSQVDLQKGTLSMHTVSPGDTTYVNRSSSHGDVGAELQYQILRERGDAMTWGLEARAGYVKVDYSGASALTSTVRLLTDAYQLGGVVPQPAPYNGSFTVQPGTQRIGDIPTRTISTVAATVQGQREFSAKGWLFRLGFVWEPIHTPRFGLQLHGGPAALNLKGTMRLNDRWVATGQPSFSQTASADRSKWLTGGYAGVTLNAHLNDQWSIFGGADYFSADTLSIHAPAAAAYFKFSHAVLANLGVSYRF